MQRLAIVLPVMRSFRQAVARVKVAEELGCESVWVPQLENARDASIVLAAYAAATTRIGLGTAVLPVLQHHPTQLAQTALTLDELSGGRFHLGLGFGHRRIAREVWGLDPGPAAEVIGEYVAAIRALVTAGRSDLRGRHVTAVAGYAGPRRVDLPILLGGQTPELLRLAGEVADGVILWLSTPSFVESVVMPNLEIGRRRAGLDMAGFEVIAEVPCCVTDEPATAQDLLRGLVAPALGLPGYRRLLVAGGLDSAAAGRIETAGLRELAGIGPRAAVSGLVKRYREAGCSLVAVVPLPDHPGAAGVEATLAAAAA